MEFSTKKKPPGKKVFLQNILAKENDPDFAGDIEGILGPDIEYDQEDAFNWMKEEIVERM